MTHDAPAYGLWMLVILNSAVFIIFAFSFRKPRIAAGLALVWGVLRLHRRPVHRDVRLPVDDLPALGLAPDPLPGPRPRCPTMPGTSGRLCSAGRATRTSTPSHPQQPGDLRRLHPALASAWKVLHEAQRAPPSGHDGRLRLWSGTRNTSPSSLIMFGFLLQWPTIMTLGDVPDAGPDVRAPGPLRGARSPPGIRGRIRALCRRHAEMDPAPFRAWTKPPQGRRGVRWVISVPSASSGHWAGWRPR